MNRFLLHFVTSSKTVTCVPDAPPHAGLGPPDPHSPPDLSSGGHHRGQCSAGTAYDSCHKEPGITNDAAIHCCHILIEPEVVDKSNIL